jgi:hypothetical protein
MYVQRLQFILAVLVPDILPTLVNLKRGDQLDGSIDVGPLGRPEDESPHPSVSPWFCLHDPGSLPQAERSISTDRETLYIVSIYLYIHFSDSISLFRFYEVYLHF